MRIHENSLVKAQVNNFICNTTSLRTKLSYSGEAVVQLPRTDGWSGKTYRCPVSGSISVSGKVEDNGFHVTVTFDEWFNGGTAAGFLIEADARAILDRDYRGAVAPAHVLGSLAAWRLDHRLRVILAGDRAGAAHLLLRLFGAVVRRLEREQAQARTAGSAQARAAAGSRIAPSSAS